MLWKFQYVSFGNKEVGKGRFKMSEPKPKILIAFENGKVMISVEKGVSLNNLVMAAFALQRKALLMATEKEYTER